MTKRNPVQKEWAVPMQFKGWGTAFVKAATAEEAEAIAESGDYNNSEIDETSDWEVCGTAEENQ